MKSIDLEQIRNYSNQSVILDFHYKNPSVTLQQAHQYFEDLMAWLWLNHHRKTLNKKTWMFGPLLKLDEMWHAFILHTRDYHGFCDAYFGEYFHHDVEPANQEHELEPDELADFLEDCFHLLGETWVDRYFSEMYA